MIRFKASFTGHGENIEPLPGRLVLDVGNRCVPGVIDHHQDGASLECTATLVLRQPELVTEHIRSTPLAEVEVMLHYLPDFDAVASAYLATALIDSGEQAFAAPQIADYALRVDQATLPVTRRPELTPYGIYAGITRMVEANPPSAPSANAAYETSYAMLDRGLDLMDYLNQAVASGASLFDESLFAGEHPFGEAQQVVAEDYRRYMGDLVRGDIYGVSLPRQDGQGTQETDLLVVKDPAAAMFKVWARQDQVYAPHGAGFGMLSVQYGDSRFVVSVDPRAGVTLRGLGAALDRAETEKRLILGLEREGPPRPGYDNSDPWYDGRAAVHNYTIVDAPRAGTVLDAGEVLGIVLHPESWFSPAAE